MIGELLAGVRKEHGHTQQDLANILQVSISTVRSWENEKSSPSHAMMVSICRMYDVSSDYLLGLSRTRRPEEFTGEELEQLQEFEAFLTWKKQHRRGK